VEARGSWQIHITPDLTEFIERQISVFLATQASTVSLISSIAVACG
jgi:hypothetical protein